MDLALGDVVKVIGKPELGTGVVRYHGKVQNHPAMWVGLEFSRPIGKNDGSSNGVVYFTCPAKHGLFVKEDGVVSSCDGARFFLAQPTAWHSKW